MSRAAISFIAIVLAGACGDRRQAAPAEGSAAAPTPAPVAPSPPPPVAMPAPAPATPADAAQVDAAAPVKPGPALADATFTGWLTRDDWSPLIDPAIGFVALTADDSHGEGQIKRWCGRRGAMYARFEALDFAAAATADPHAAPHCTELASGAIECRPATVADHNHRFRFGRRGNGFVLQGIESSGTAVSPEDEQRFDAEIADPRRCEE